MTAVAVYVLIIWTGLLIVWGFAGLAVESLRARYARQDREADLADARPTDWAWPS